MNWLLRLFRRKQKPVDDVRCIQLDNAQFLPVVVELLHEQSTVTLPLRGNSMRPFLHDGRDKALLQLTDMPCIGDAVLAEITHGHYVLHRIVAIDGNHVTLRGDGNLSDEHCRLTDIRAKAIAFYRKGRNTPDLTDGLKWKVYSWWWMRLFPVRRYLLFLLRPHIPRRWTKKGNK
jgi:hypothetical protein